MDSEAPKTPRAKDLPSIPHYRALLIDDDPSTREFVSYVFGENYLDRCEIVTCSGLGEAIHLIEHQPERKIDVVLLDLGLTETQGLGTYLEFRKFVQDLPVIVFTGNDDPALKKRLIVEGAHDVIPKGSMTPLGLYQAICNAVIQGRYRDTAQRIEVIRLPEILLRDAKDVREDLRVQYDSLPPNSTDKVRNKAHMVGLEILTELSREVGGLNAAVLAMRKDLDSLADAHDDTRESVVDLKVDVAKDQGKTFREKLKLAAKVLAILAAVVAGASWREAIQTLLGMLK